MSVQLIQGDAREVLATLPDESVNCCVTSPPYWGLRDYGHAGQIGLESTPAEYVAQMVGVFAQVRRVLREDGTLWLNLGDSYVGGGRGGGGSFADERPGWTDVPMGMGEKRSIAAANGLKPKDLVGIPWRVAFALQADGWYLRSDIIWHKPNPMPESVRDRPTKAHEYIFLMSKSDRYAYDADAISDPLAASSVVRLSQDLDNQTGSFRANGGAKTNGTMKAVKRMPPIGGIKAPGNNGNATYSGNTPEYKDTRNARSVWTIPTTAYSGAHFATFPPALVDRCIRAGCPIGGMVLDPFMGTATTLEVAIKHNRNAIGIELNPEYMTLARARLHERAGLFAGDAA